ncbi:hypothetical protein [Streptomyces sp. NPDC058701]|uniref:hypothetical protein n=1 Tax=Streptomyces sp. NPDC058701 TaxID=3346608 RepID=UPI0036569DF9
MRNILRAAAAVAALAGSFFTIGPAQAAEALPPLYDLQVKFQGVDLSELHDCDFLEAVGCDNVEMYGSFGATTPHGSYRMNGTREKAYLTTERWKGEPGSGDQWFGDCVDWRGCYRTFKAGAHGIGTLGQGTNGGAKTFEGGLGLGDSEEQMDYFATRAVWQAGKKVDTLTVPELTSGDTYLISMNLWDHDDMWGDDEIGQLTHQFTFNAAETQTQTFNMWKQTGTGKVKLTWTVTPVRVR